MTAYAITVKLYAADGSTLVGTIANRKGVQYLEELNGPGSGSVQVALTDSLVSSLGYGKVIKFEINGTTVGAFQIEKINRDIVVEEPRYVTVSGRGLLSWLQEAVVYPQGGFSVYSPTDRPFNFAAIGIGAWEARNTWTAPVGLAWGSVTDVRKGAPKGWPDRKGYWIWKTNPNSATAAGAINYFRSTLTTSTTQKVRFYATADNAFELYLDGTLIIQSASMGNGESWTRITSKTITVPSGTHNIAVRAWNGANGSGTNKAGFLFVATTVGTRNRPVKILRRSDTTHWTVTAQEPLLYPSEILKVLINEAQTRSVTGVSHLSIGWTATLDSSGRAWSSAIAKTIRCGKDLLTVHDEMADQSMDMWVNPSSLSLNAYETKGADKSATVVLSVANDLLSYTTEATSTIRTAALVRTIDGWAQATNATGITNYGRRETYLEFGNTTNETTAANAAARMLMRTATPTITSIQVEAYPITGAVPLIDFGVGDKVATLSSTGTSTTARVLNIALTEEDDSGVVKFAPLLEVLV